MRLPGKSPREAAVPTSKGDLLRRFGRRFGVEHRCRRLLDFRDDSEATRRILEILDQRCLAWIEVCTATGALNAPEDMWLLMEQLTHKSRSPMAGEAASVYASAASTLTVYLMFAKDDRDVGNRL